MNKRLIVLDGDDRAGKDTVLKEISKVLISKEAVYYNDLTGKPDYHDREAYKIWLDKFLKKQAKDLDKLFETNNTVYMVRLDLCDKVYSELFNRPVVAPKYFIKLRKYVDIRNFVMLWANYAEYLQRLTMINDSNIEYTANEMEKIHSLYKKYMSHEDKLFEAHYNDNVHSIAIKAVDFGRKK